MKISDKARQIIGAVAPVLGATLGGPLGGLAGQVLSKTFGVDDPKQLETAVLAQSPDSITKIRLAEIELQKAAESNELDLERINAADRANAREREIKTGDSTTRILAYTVVGAFCAMVFAVLFGKIGVDSALAGAVIGYLSAKAEQVCGYYFGSSASSKSKDDTLAQIAKQP